MKVKITPKKLTGTIPAVASKSFAHRALICAALAEGESKVWINTTSEDIEATVRCLRALGSKIEIDGDCYRIGPMDRTPKRNVVLDCGESGSTLRFLVPIVAALGINGHFVGQGKLFDRPMDELAHQLALHGAKYENNCVTGTLQGGIFSVRGDISSQFITGLMFALPLLKEESKIVLTTPLSSASYVDITKAVLKDFGVTVEENEGYSVQGTYRAKHYQVEGDWSNSAFFLAANCTVRGLNENSLQGDKEIIPLLKQMDEEEEIHISARNIPDLVPILAVAAAIKGKYCRITDAERLIYKESDRLQSVWEMLCNLGIRAEKHADGLSIYPSVISGGKINCYNDHRIAMAAAIGASFATDEVWIEDASAVDKSYRNFWQDFAALGGLVEVYDE